MKNYTSLEESLFRNRDAFEIDFVPEIFNFREAQMKDIVYAIQPGMQGNRPINLVLRGLPGTGKTTAVRQGPEFDNPVLWKESGKGPLNPASHTMPPSVSGRSGKSGADTTSPSATFRKLMNGMM